MNRLLLGLGNDLLSDDGVGLVVVRQLKPALTQLPGLDVLETSEMGLALLDFITGYRAAVLVDAVQTGKAPPGFIHHLEPDALPRLSTRTPHTLGIGETLALGRTLGLPMPKQVRILAIEVQDPYTLGTALTPILQAALPAILAQVTTAVQALVESIPELSS